MTQEEITDKVLKDLHSAFNVLYPEAKRNFTMAARMVGYSCLHLKPSQLPIFVTDFLIRYTDEFDLMRDYTGWAYMVRDFIKSVQHFIFDTHKCESEWYKALNIKLDTKLIKYIKEESEYFSEIPRLSVKDVEKAAGCKRVTVFNYVKALKIPKHGDGQNAFKERDFKILIKGITTRTKDIDALI